ncbi:MAG: hypothetical protein AAFQ94_19985 [Bacteroidota bacterium]
MEIMVLNQLRKALNTTKTITSICFAIGLSVWLIIMPFNNRVAAYILLFTLPFLGLFLIVALFSWLYKPKVSIPQDKEMMLLINSELPLNEIQNPKAIQYAKNFIVEKETEKTIGELDNKQTFELLQSDQFEKKLRYERLNFFQNRPNGFLGFFVELADAFS